MSVRNKRNLPDDAEITQHSIRRRIERKKVFVTQTGLSSPLLALENTIVTLLIQMGRIRQCLSPSQSLQLVNSLIDGTKAQQDLIQWKTKYTNNIGTSVGKGYWRGFMRRNGNKICSKRGAKYELDRASWSTYANFTDMYDHIIEEMVDAGVAIKLDAPVWMNKEGEIVKNEEDAFGCKVSHQITRPEMCIVGDEVGGNISMKGDGHAGGQLFVCEKGTIPQKKYPKETNDSH